MTVDINVSESKNLILNSSRSTDVNLRNESNIFSVDRGINQKGTENCINAHSAFVAKVFRSFFG